MVMEKMEGGELFDYVVEKGTLSEEEVGVCWCVISLIGGREVDLSLCMYIYRCVCIYVCIYLCI